MKPLSVEDGTEMARSGAVIRRMGDGLYFVDWGNVHFGTTLQGMSNFGHDLTLYADREKRGKQ